MTSITAPLLEIAVLVLGMVILMIEAFAGKIDKRVLAYAAIAGLAIVLLATFFVVPSPAPTNATGFWSFYTADRLAIFFKQFALLTTILVLIMMLDYAPVVRSFFPGAAPQTGLGEFVALPLFTCAGLMYLVSAIDFVFIFVALELVTVSFYVLVSFTRRNPATLEAGTKYLVLSALSTAFLVYGIAWIFGATGQTNLYRLTAALANAGTDSAAALLGMVFVLVALGFKIAAVPFQIWVPDVYQGAPTPVTAYLSVGSKAAGFVVLLRVLQPFMNLPQTERLIFVIALLTLIYGNLAALPQTNLKRLLAYSSIAHAGYLLIGVLCFDVRAIIFYLVAYLVDDTVEFCSADNRRAANRRRNFRFRWSCQTLAISRFCDADRDGLACRCAVHRGISRQVLHLLRSRSATSDRTCGCWSDHGRLRILLLSQSCARDVLAV